MSSHYVRTRPANPQSAFKHNQTPHVFRTGAYILVALVLGLLFVHSADNYARDIERLREIGVPTSGTITQANKAVNGGRQAGYWLFGTFPALSASGRDLTLTFNFNVTEAEFNSAQVGDSIALLYDPDRVNTPIRADDIARMDTVALRVGAVAGAGLYLLIGIALSVTDWRLRVRVSRRQAKLRSAFGLR